MGWEYIIEDNKAYYTSKISLDNSEDYYSLKIEAC